MKQIWFPKFVQGLEEGQTPSSKRLTYIDVIKGFGILCVVAGHVLYGTITAMADLDTQMLWNIYNGIYSFHMPLFMIISGFMFERAYFGETNRAAEAKKRLNLQIWNLIGVYLIFELIPLLRSAVKARQVSAADFLLIPVRPNGELWYLYALVLYYIVFSTPGIRKLPVKLLLPVLLAMSAMKNVIPSEPEWFALRSICYHPVFFYIGMLRCRNRDGFLFRRGAVALLSLSALVLSIVWWEYGRTLNSITGVNFAVGLGFSLLLIFLFESCKALSNNQLLRICGQYSLEIYLLHNYLIRKVLESLLRLGVGNMYMLALLCTAVCALLPVIVGILCKKLNLYGLFKPAAFIRNMRKMGPPTN